MQLKRPLPPERTYEQVLNHYIVEKELATRLKSASRELRPVILNSMYEELFRKVPDHPRLLKRQDDKLTARSVGAKLALIRRFLPGVNTCVEFAPGDCRFAVMLAGMVAKVYGIDISDQRNPDDKMPVNFELVIYDGYEVSSPESCSVDLIFSDQLIEHLHPDDTRLHFELALDLLKPGGKYVFRTPHALTGPHDVSKYFSDVAQGFHLKEWTYTEINKLLLEVGYSSVDCYRLVGRQTFRMPYAYYLAAEYLLTRALRRLARRMANPLIASVYAAAVK